MKVSVYLHSLKEQVFKFFLFRKRSSRSRRLFGAGIFLALVVEIILLACYLVKPSLAWLIAAQVFFSVSALVLGGMFVCLLCFLNMRGVYRNIFFMILFVAGVGGYIALAKNEAAVPEKISSNCSRNAQAAEETKKEPIILMARGSGRAEKNPLSQWLNGIFISAMHHSHMTLAAFFPSRGSYEIDSSGTINSKKMEFFPTLLLYFIFHAFVYIFTSYFIISHWGYRTTNRLRFWLTRDDEKNVFWCVMPEPKMLTLAKDILKKHRETMQPVFSAEEAEVSEPQSLFQEMNYQKFCLKLRKPDQIHSNCLHAARNFFLSEDSDWNINMARAFLAIRKKYGVESFTQLYIRISDEARELFFNRWADDNNIPGKVDIIVIDEAEMIAEKFVAENPMLKTLDAAEINTETAMIPNAEFKVLIIGFGRIGRALLKHIICDSQFVKRVEEEKVENPASRSQTERVPFSADIIDCDTERWTIFKHTHKEACERFNLNFVQMQVLSDNFFDLKWENLKNYNRIVIALGKAELNIEVAAAIENMIRKTISLPSSETLGPTADPRKQLEEIRKQCFLFSPDIHNFQGDEKNSDHLFNNTENLFSLAGADYEIYCCENIIEEKLSIMAKFIALGYCINYGGTLKPEVLNERQKHADLRKAYGLPVLPCDLTLKDFSSLPSDLKKKIMQSWYTGYDKDNHRMTAVSMYGRKSSRASAANLKNILSLLGLNESKEALTEYEKRIQAQDLKNTLGRTEHLRWMAYIFLEGHALWQAPLKTEQCSEANQSKKYYRHAALVEYEDLPDIDKIFPNSKKTFWQKDLEIIEHLPLFFREYNMFLEDIRQDVKQAD